MTYSKGRRSLERALKLCHETIAALGIFANMLQTPAAPMHHQSANNSRENTKCNKQTQVQVQQQTRKETPAIPRLDDTLDLAPMLNPPLNDHTCAVIDHAPVFIRTRLHLIDLLPWPTIFWNTARLHSSPPCSHARPTREQQACTS